MAVAREATALQETTTPTEAPPRALAEALRQPRAAQLSLARHQLRSIPPELEGLQHLQELDLSDNQLESLAGMPHLRNLTALDLSWNRLRRVPVELMTQDGLRRLDLSNNQFENQQLSREAIRELLPECEVIF